MNAQLVVEKKALAKASGLALLASGRGAKDVALANVLISQDHGSTTIESYDMHVYSRATFQAQGDPVMFAVDGTRLEHLITAADDGPMTFDISPDGAKVSFGRANINIRTFPVDKYVRMMPNGLNTVAQSVRSSSLLNAIEFVRPFIGKDTQKPAQMNTELRNGRFLAGDGVRIGIVRVPNFPFRLKIPNVVIGNVIRWLKEAVGCVTVSDEEKLIDVQETNDFYFLSTGVEVFAWRKPEHEFMAIEPFLDKFEAEDDENRVTFKVDRESLQRMVGSLSVVLEAGAERVLFKVDGQREQPILIGVTIDSRGVESFNQIQVVVDRTNGDNSFSLRYTHLLETLKLATNPVITCDVRKSKNILKIMEPGVEMEKTALLTLMSD